MRKLVIEVTCSVCGRVVYDDGEQIPEREFVWDGATYKLDSCPEHDLTEYAVRDLIGMSTDTKRPPTPSGSKRAKTVPCPTCGKMFGTQKGMHRHHTVYHGEKLT